MSRGAANQSHGRMSLQEESKNCILCLLLLCAAASGCGPTSGKQEIDVPPGLIVHCEKVFSAGTLTVDGPWVEAGLAEGECLVYDFAVVEGSDYAVQVLVAAGNVDLIVSAGSDFLGIEGMSMGYGDADESVAFTASESKKYYAAVVSRAPESTFSIRVLKALSTGSGECEAVVDGGELVVDAAARSDLVFGKQCVLYTFAGTAGTVYRLTLTLQPESAAPEEMKVADDSSMQNILKWASFLGPTTRLYPVATGTQPHYVLVVGDYSDTAHYDISIEAGNAPAGLADFCFHARDRGPLTPDWVPVEGSVAVMECDIYTFDATLGSLYAVGSTIIGLNGELRLSPDADFEPRISTDTETIEGASGETFVAGATQTHYAGIVNRSDTDREYNVRLYEGLPAPEGLTYTCNRSESRGSLTADGPAVDDTVKSYLCAIYTMSTQAGVTYSVSAIPIDGAINLYVGEDPDYLTPIAESINFNGAQGLSFTATADATVYIIVAGRSPEITFTLSAVTARTAPSGLNDECQVVIEAPELSVGSPPVEGFAAADHCVLYSFSGVNGTSYTVTVAGKTEYDNPDLTIAGDPDFTTIIDKEETPDDDTIVFTAASDQLYHVAVHSFQDAEYTLSLSVSPAPPPGLTGECASVKDGGVLTVGAPSARDTAAIGQCVLFSFAGTAGTDYTVTMYAMGGDPGMKIANDADFLDLLTTQSTQGGETYNFTAAATQSFFIGVFPTDPMTTSFEIFVTSP